jgi:hypothetical protein
VHGSMQEDVAETPPPRVRNRRATQKIISDSSDSDGSDESGNYSDAAEIDNGSAPEPATSEFASEAGFSDELEYLDEPEAVSFTPTAFQ